MTEETKPEHVEPVRIYVALGAYAPVTPHIYANHIAFFCREKKLAPPHIQIGIQCWERTPLLTFRNGAADEAIAADFDKLLFIDDDLRMPLDGPTVLGRLLSAQKYSPITAGLVFRRAWPYFPMMWTKSETDDHRKFFEQILKWEGGIGLTVDAVHLACTMIDVNLLREMKAENPLIFEWDMSSDDIKFCRRASELGVRPVVDTSIQPLHMGLASQIGIDTFEAHLAEAKADPERLQKEMGATLIRKEGSEAGFKQAEPEVVDG